MTRLIGKIEKCLASAWTLSWINDESADYDPDALVPVWVVRWMHHGVVTDTDFHSLQTARRFAEKIRDHPDWPSTYELLP